MRGERHDVHAQPPVEGVQIFGERFPGPGHAGPEARQRHAFDLRQHPRDVIAVFGFARRQPEAAVGHEHAGEAVPDARRRQRIPEQLCVVVGMHVDEAGRDDQPRGVDRLGRAAVHLAQRDDLARGNRDVAGVAGLPASIDQESVLDEQIILHDASPARTARSAFPCMQRRFLRCLRPFDKLRDPAVKDGVNFNRFAVRQQGLERGDRMDVRSASS